MTTDAALADALRALGTPARVQLLRELRTPKTVTEVELRAPGSDGPGRVLARQTIKQHLDQLVEIGVVATRSVERSHGPTLEYVVNHQTLFALGEDLRSLARLRPTEAPAGLTRVAPVPPPAARRAGPQLLLVKGLDEGLAFDLRPHGPGPAAWVIGRRRGLAVPLDFDAAVSTEHARVTWDGDRHSVEDLPHSRNGTLVNFRPLEKGRLHALERGDVISVGRSALVFQA
jgi:DNA-binding HxlR family transcriptional regulator